ncbi:MAG: transcription elongation factor GreA [Chitinophagales bacterium]|jgi:transcription elongation factor GreA|nr:transcription elongation factor GreA [Bacteroidota bacterium]MBK9506204.1 transcription elongation factor GreA [Bacteroidota bacterium]MBK9555309.1 transcription elongation factor GreA [Bacteroidota bacterium]MBL0279631.1 transcription elongation factor GreA [Bacteroidota bacterium]MBP9878480.1 transcription elongation factor GreA [Chitinophagales bacterium]
MADIIYLSKEGMENLKVEIQELKTKGRAEMSRQIKEAREKGDLSENAEYDAAKEAQGLMEMKIAKLEELLMNARLLDESKIDTSKVSVFTTVKLHDTKFKKDIKYTLVSEKEADIKTGKISVTSPIGKGLLGKKVGDTVNITVPAGVIEFKILEITV